MAYFFSCSKTSDESRVTALFFNHVVKLHGLPKTMVLDRDVKLAILVSTMVQDGNQTEILDGLSPTN